MRAFSTLMAIGLAVAVAASFAHAIPEDPHIGVMQNYGASLKRFDAVAGLIRYSTDQLNGTAAAFVESQKMAEIAASISRGREVEVYALYRRLNIGDGVTQDVLQDISPHPFPNFLRESGTKFFVSHKYVVGNGAYLGLGLPPYPGAQDLVAYVPGQYGMRAATDDPETARQYAQWNVYKLTIELWKERRFESPPRLQSRAGDANGRAHTLYPPHPDAVKEVRDSLRRLEMRMDDIERGVQALQHEFDVYISRRTPTTDTMQFQSEIAALRPQLALLRNYLDAVGSIGVTSALTREEGSFYRVLYFLSRELRARAAAYENGLVQQRETQNRLSFEQAVREIAARRVAWNYLKAFVGTACADPENAASRQESGGKIRGVELSHTDFASFFIEDSTRHLTVMDVVRGEYVLPPNECQLTILKAMLEHSRPLPITSVVQRAAQYRREHPDLVERLAQGMEAVGKEFDQFFRDLHAAFQSPSGAGPSGSTYYEQSEDSSSSDTYRDESERSAGMRSRNHPNIDLRRPDFGRGSTLGH